eukprot:3574461-Rhodomonas_salina.3
MVLNTLQSPHGHGLEQQNEDTGSEDSISEHFSRCVKWGWCFCLHCRLPMTVINIMQTPPETSAAASSFLRGNHNEGTSLGPFGPLHRCKAVTGTIGFKSLNFHFA